ncbi:antibiotic biosynthesis monooxygenase family protein [Kistimonas asteriae]|uniref:antibiotic biosynthesis monooxygenase family protein n=1 Tax=Kistimonas asteriae TaxID=517724 RepID=UPI001BA5D473|nr:antibiotic biosynthesis monooxygenase [Kistimonas asteriae]
MTTIADTPEPPYYAVIFTSLRTEDDNGYDDVAVRMLKLAQEQPGFLGVESAREGVGITVSYWQDIAAIRAWKAQADHQEAQRRGKQQWYRDYRVRVCRVERVYGLS